MSHWRTTLYANLKSIAGVTIKRCSVTLAVLYRAQPVECLAEQEYLWIQASRVYRAICAEYNLEHSKDWWVEPEKVVRDDHAKILWNFPIQTDKHLLHNRPDQL